MCGINGVFHFSSNNSQPDLIAKMNDALIHRGPDAEGAFVLNNVQLGHRRLSIIDVSQNSNQPFISSDENYVIVFNGEIYNFKSLKNQLTDYSFRTQSDTEVVLAAYIKWGEKCVNFFNGMFAFAIYNKHKNDLFIARDRLGIKPLYYFYSNDVFIFSSSLKSILSTGLVEKKMSQNGLVDYLRYQTVHAPDTIIENIKVLMPGCLAKINEEDGLVIREFWNITTFFQTTKGGEAEVHAAIKNKLSESVEMQLVADVPFGAFLSGGIDSSLLVGLMAQAHDKKVDTFSVVFKETEFSEQEYAKLVADKFKTNHHEIELTVRDFRDLIPEALSFMDHPSGDGPNTFVVSKKTREAGIKMAISGLGGDELFCGYSIFNQIPTLQAKKWLRSFPAYARGPMASLYRSLKKTVAADKIAQIMTLENFDTEDIYQYYRQVFLDEQVAKLLNKSVLTRNVVFDSVSDLIGYKQTGWYLPKLSRISVAEISTYMQNVLLRDADQMSMANSLEIRVPFLDHELVELAMGIPDNIKNPITPKKILTDIYGDFLPKEVYQRQKMGFVLPYDTWLKNDLRSFCQTKIDYLKTTGHFNAHELDKLWNCFLNGSKRITWSRIWPLVVLANWMQQNNVR